MKGNQALGFRWLMLNRHLMELIFLVSLAHGLGPCAHEMKHMSGIS